MKDFYLYNEITSENLNELKDFLQNAKDVNIHINSGGGEVFTAIAMATLLKSHSGKVTAIIEGVAASAATVIVCAADNVRAADNALIMVHLPSVFLFNDFNNTELTKIQNALNAIKDSIIMGYENKLKVPRAEIESMMVAEKWLTAEEAKEIGFVDEVFEQNRNWSNLMTDNNIFMEKYKDSVLVAERGRIQALNSAKTDNPFANSIIDVAISEGKTLDEVQKYIDAVKGVGTSNINEFTKIISDNMNSGADGVNASVPADEKAEYANCVAGFVKQNLAGLGKPSSL